MSCFCGCFVALYLDAPRLSLCQSKGLIACPFSTLLPVETQNVALLLNRWSQAKQINRGKYIRAVRLGCYRFMCHVSFLSNNLACARDLSQVLGPGQDTERFLSTAQALNSISRVTGFPFPVLLVYPSTTEPKRHGCWAAKTVGVSTPTEKAAGSLQRPFIPAEWRALSSFQQIQKDLAF